MKRQCTHKKLKTINERTLRQKDGRAPSPRKTRHYHLLSTESKRETLQGKTALNTSPMDTKQGVYFLKNTPARSLAAAGLTAAGQTSPTGIGATGLIFFDDVA